LLGFQIIAIGDSYNDLKMIKEADLGVLFNPPKNIIEKNQKFQVAKNYRELKSLLIKFLKNEKDYRKN
jgi:phosphoserine/homoserine phosphotransferase